MTTINRSALLPYQAGQIYQLVNDIEAYPQFMDGCVGAEVLYRDASVVEARLDLSKGGITQSFSTRNFLEHNAAIRLELLDGPFERFHGCWEFKALGEAACKVALELEFRASNAVLGLAASKLFDKVTNNLVDALAQRARMVYG
ncbi:type II toxin-antitoxin system RatA family toxin [Parahaliea sp. F7430]|uniref:Type II toxin-antitoxin system RatA family toxin n=1 Tax=Sediminihaliea albiluteola TaxID=2758564 RepID=A0A7W2TYC2_9GAMM|nr:type II toxin-antitoxin system RatA family toxin [Sediminihaliea albiluteola]MBA6414195.1 type II toxin-antitoxin system RatA family toxin [Sediminihaliea albiluteola]